MREKSYTPKEGSKIGKAFSWGIKKAGYGWHELQSNAVTRRDLFHNQHKNTITLAYVWLVLILKIPLKYFLLPRKKIPFLTDTNPLISRKIKKLHYLSISYKNLVSAGEEAAIHIFYGHIPKLNKNIIHIKPLKQ